VRDIADAHTLALGKEDAAGERIIISQGPWKIQDWIHASRKFGADVPAGDQSYDPIKATHYIRYDTSKASTIV